MQTLHVRIISPQQLILDTEASSVSSRNLRGNFDILPQHANFISLIENSPIVVRVLGPVLPATRFAESRRERGEQKPLVFKFPLAIIITRENKVNIYTYVSDTVGKESSAYIQP